MSTAATEPRVSTGFAVLDLETTGLHPRRGARIIEIGIVAVDDSGNPQHRWQTLIDPDCHPGPTHIHGVDAAMLVGAPHFADVAGNLAEVLSGRVLVAHNAKFDVGFLDAEFAKAGVAWQRAPLCTLNMARRRGLPLSLAACCETFSIVNHGAHHALGDAVATAELLARLDCEPDELPNPVAFPHGWPTPAGASVLRTRP